MWQQTQLGQQRKFYNQNRSLPISMRKKQRQKRWIITDFLRKLRHQKIIFQIYFEVRKHWTQTPILSILLPDWTISNGLFKVKNSQILKNHIQTNIAFWGNIRPRPLKIASNTTSGKLAPFHSYFLQWVQGGGGGQKQEGWGRTVVLGSNYSLD